MGKYNLTVKREEYKPVPGAEGLLIDSAGSEHVSFRRLLEEARPAFWLILWGTLALFASAGANLATPALFGRVIDTLALPTPADESSSQDDLRVSVLALVAVSVGGALFSFLRGYLFSLAGEGIVARLRKQLFASLLVS